MLRNMLERAGITIGLEFFNWFPADIFWAELMTIMTTSSYLPSLASLNPAWLSELILLGPSPLIPTPHASHESPNCLNTGYEWYSQQLAVSGDRPSPCRAP
ncbi:hypothetical protein MVEN_01151400 [Mycena venus]|uniref:Uncharacterized protein n=1 Tax=Mycena venus TaxID=2733690 RepID=A0A8H7CXK8_9AGAR|nr:hypothetical protein MVEN_01151400 [Mycena venus]